MTSSSTRRWFHIIIEVTFQDNPGLTHLLSNIWDELYPQSQRLLSKLINRRSLSTKVAATRCNSLEANLKHPSEENLEFEGYPPEHSMYKSLLQTKDPYRQDKTGTRLLRDPSDSDPLHLCQLWEVLADISFYPPAEPHPMVNLFYYLKQSPYILTDEVLTIFFCAFLLVHQHETALFHGGSLLPELRISDWEVVL